MNTNIQNSAASTSTVKTKRERHADSLNPKKNPTKRRRNNTTTAQPNIVTIKGQPLPTAYKHRIPQKLIGIYHAPAKKTLGAFGGGHKTHDERKGGAK